MTVAGAECGLENSDSLAPQPATYSQLTEIPLGEPQTAKEQAIVESVEQPKPIPKVRVFDREQLKRENGWW